MTDSAASRSVGSSRNGRESRPNILFVFPDQHRPDWVGHWGNVPVRTPTIDRLADEGVSFRNALCPSPLCGPSRACLASGREYDRCGVRDHRADYPIAAPTLYGRLREAGYHVMGTGKFDIQKHSSQQGLDGKRFLEANGFSDGVNNAGKWNAYGHGEDGTPGEAYTKFLSDEGLLETHIEDFRLRRDDDLAYHEGIDVHATFPTDLPDHAYCDNYVGRNTVELLRAAPTDRPWFMQVNFVGPHNPWDVTEDMHGWYRDPDVAFPEPIEPNDRFDAATHQEIRRNYAAMVENVDRWLDRFLSVVEERGEREETIVVFASDHGEMLGDHGGWYKRTPYRASAGIPFVVAGPGVESRGVVDAPATILDLHATGLDYAGLDPARIDPDMDSRSMRAYLEGASEDEALRDVAYSGMGAWRLAFDGRYTLVRGFDPEKGTRVVDPWDEAAVQDYLESAEPLLWDRANDPHDVENVAGSFPVVVDRLSESIEELRTA